jgi:hypothetical protein
VAEDRQKGVKHRARFEQFAENTSPLVGDCPAASSSVPAARSLWIIAEVERLGRLMACSSETRGGTHADYFADAAVRGALWVRQRAGFVAAA